MAEMDGISIVHFSSEDELLVETDGERRGLRLPRRSTAAVIIGALALVACGVFAVVGSRSQNLHRDNQVFSLRMLLESPAVHEVATHNIVKVQRRMTGSSLPKSDMHKIVKEQFAKIGAKIQQGSPKALDSTTISKTHHDAVVHMMRYLSDAQVQSIGLETAHAIRDAGSEDPEILKQHIVHKLAPQQRELKALHSAVFPPEVRDIFSKHNDRNDAFKELFEPKRLRLLKSFDDRWDQVLSTQAEKDDDKVEHARQLRFLDQTTTRAPLAVALDVMGIVGAVAQEVSVLLRMIKPLTKILPGSSDINLSPTATSAIGLVDALFNTISCELDAVQDDDNPIELASCPLMSGSAAFDMLRGVFAHTGLLGDNNAANGVQGEHGGPTNAALAAAAAGDPVKCVFYGNCGDTTTTTTAFR
jgi:hypothetical protein